MSKYICLCGATYANKITADLHAKMYEDLELSEGFPRHKIFVQRWEVRLVTWFFSVNWKRFSRFCGAYIVYFVLVRHFGIHWGWIEAMAIGIGMGLYIE